MCWFVYASHVKCIVLRDRILTVLLCLCSGSMGAEAGYWGAGAKEGGRIRLSYVIRKRIDLQEPVTESFVLKRRFLNLVWQI